VQQEDQMLPRYDPAEHAAFWLQLLQEYQPLLTISVSCYAIFSSTAYVLLVRTHAIVGWNE
jgi:hypothetical protein